MPPPLLNRQSPRPVKQLIDLVLCQILRKKHIKHFFGIQGSKEFRGGRGVLVRRRSRRKKRAAPSRLPAKTAPNEAATAPQVVPE